MDIELSGDVCLQTPARICTMKFASGTDLHGDDLWQKWVDFDEAFSELQAEVVSSLGV